jgi:hypothetical protein
MEDMPTSEKTLNIALCNERREFLPYRTFHVILKVNSLGSLGKTVMASNQNPQQSLRKARLQGSTESAWLVASADLKDLNSTQ